MIDLYMKQEMGRSYLVYPLTEAISDYQMRMITENHIEGLVDCRLGNDDEHTVLLYDVTNMKALKKEYGNTSIEFNEIKNLFESIGQMLDTGDNYLLEERGFLLDPSYIMCDMENDKLRYIYIPFGNCYKRDPENAVYHQLADFLIESVNHRDEASVSIVYQFYSMSKEPTFSIRLFTNIIDKEEIVSNHESDAVPLCEERTESEDIYIEDEEEIHWRGVVLVGLICLIVPVVYYFAGIDHIYMTYLILFEIIMAILFVSLIIRNLYKIIQQRHTSVDIVPDRDITVDDYWGNNQETQFFDDKTTFFDADNKTDDVCFEWKEKGITKKYRATHFPVVIGKLINEVDCRIDDPSISRMHVKVNNRGGKLSILDLNSTNGTQVDGRKIRPGEEVTIGMSSEIMLGQVILRVL